MSTHKRRAWHTRRRTRSVGSMPFEWQPPNSHMQTQSDEMCSSSTSKDKGCSSFYQSDSDDLCSSVNRDSSFVFGKTANPSNNMESDSFNENSAGRPLAKRKRKFKKMAMDVDIAHSSRMYPHWMLHYSKKKRILRHPLNCQNKFVASAGKRRKVARDKYPSLDGGDSSDLGCRESKVLAISKLSLNDSPDDQCAMDVSFVVHGEASSSISSSGSEAGIFTNDEGREGDDEQSDWVGDLGAATASCLPEDDDNNSEKGDHITFQRYFLGSLDGDDKKTKDMDIRASRKKCRSFKSSNMNILLPTDLKDGKIFGKTQNLEVETGLTTRRHTFSGYKKRKRIPQSSLPILETTSEISSQMSIPEHKLSDISSSDSKESPLA